MEDFEDVVETNTVDTNVSSTPAIDNNEPEPVATPKTIKKSSNKGYETLLKRSAQNTADELRNQATFLGEQERIENDKIAAQTAIYNDTLDNVARTAVVFPVNSDGTIHFPEIQPPEELKTPEERDRYIRNQQHIQDRLKYLLNEYDEAKTTSGDNLKYIVGSAIRSGINLVGESLGAVPIVGGMAVQAIGTLGGKDNFVTRTGVLMQEWTVNLLDSINDGLTYALINERRATEVGREAANVIDAGAQVAAIAASVYSGGAAIAGKVSRKAAARGISEAAAKRASKTAAKTFAERAGNITSAMYASAQTENYLTRPREGMSNEEYLEYLKSKTGGEILGDLAFGALVGISNYYLEKTFGAEASIKNFFGPAADGFVRLATRRAYQEGLTEIAQDEVLDIADLFRGYILGNETRKISGIEFLENLISPQTLETFVVSAVIGGAAASAEYRSARVNLVKEYKQGLRKVFPDATEEQLETASKAFVNSTEENVIGKMHQSLMADDQLRNQYGVYNTIVQNRINYLIDQTVAKGEELAFKDKSPEYQAQFVASTAQRFVDELYAQAILRGVPVNEVFDVTKIDTKDGIMYMYGAEYGKRPLTALTANLTPAQYEQMQVEKRIADELQKKQKEQAAQIKKALQEARIQEREQAKKEKKALQEARIFARAEIRDMDTDLARGILATLREDLPVESMKNTEIKAILRANLDSFMALENRQQIQPISALPDMQTRQDRIVKRVRMAKPKSFSQVVQSAGISKDTVEKLGLAGEFRQILGDNYRFYVRKNGKISNLEEFVAEYQREGDSYQGTVNGFLDLLARDINTKDVYSPEQDSALRLWEERSIRAGREAQAKEIDAREQELADATARLQDKGVDTSAMTEEQILEQGRILREQEYAQMDNVDADIDYEQIPDDLYFHTLREQSDLADENARLDDIYPEYTGDTINIDGVERTVYNSNGDRIAKSAEALTNFWNWFGDSKVVDDKGRPLVVYHGSGKVFDTFKPRTKFRDMYGNPIIPDNPRILRDIAFFSSNKSVAQGFGRNRFTGEEIVYPVYLKIENPQVFDEKGGQWNALSESDWLNETPMDKDGIIVENLIEGNDGTLPNATDYIVFNSNQIKSTENRGTFSPDTGNIFYQRIRSVFDLKVGDNIQGMGTVEKISDRSITINGIEYSKLYLDSLATYGGLETVSDTQDIDFNKAKKYFSTTTNLDIAGYVLPDGTMLDFSGKKFGADGRDRIIDHREIGDAYDNEIDMDDFLRAGAIRIDARKGVINAAKMPTAKQIKILERLVNQNLEVVSLELEGVAGTLNRIYENTSPDQIKKIIRGYFNNASSKIAEFLQKDGFGQQRLAAWNPLRRSIQLFSGANETSIAHELSHFWLDNMMLYSRLNVAAKNQGFMAVWSNIKKYLNIDDRQERVSEAQAEKYTSAYMQYIRNNKIAPAMDLGFKGLDEYIGDISLDYFENAIHREDDGTITSELEAITPEMIDAFQKLTSADLSQLRDRLIDIQMSEEEPETVSDAKLGKEATPEQMRREQEKEIRTQQEKQIEQNTAAAVRESQPVEPQTPSKEMREAYDSLAKAPVTSSNYEIGTSDVEAFAKAREIIARDRTAAEIAVSENPSGVTDGVPNAFIALELAQQAIQSGKNATPYLESFANGASAAGASLRTANLLNQPDFAWAKDIYEAAKAKEYGLALRMRPQVKNALMHRSAILRSMESRLDEYVEKLYPQLLEADSYEAQVKLINEWGNNTAKDLGLIPGTETWGQTIKGVSAKKTDFGKQIAYQKKKLKEFLKSKLGADLTDAEQLKVRELHRNAMDSLRALRTNPTDWDTKVDFVKKTRAYQDYLNSLQPANWATAMFASIPRASMLLRISTQVKNTLGTRMEVLLSDLNRQLRYGKDNLISSKDIKEQISESMKMFVIGGFSPDVQESFFESPTLAWGEKQFSLAARGGERRGAVFSKERLAQDAQDIAAYAKNTWQKAEGYKKAWAATKIGVATMERAAGKSYDTMAYCDAYMKALSSVHESAKAATFYAKQEGKAKGWTKDQIKARAEELFADARSYIPKTKIGEAIRKQATEQAKLETFIKSGTLAQIANNIRNGLNLGKESGIGTIIAPFVSTPANIMQLGVDYSFGWWRRFDGWSDVKKRIEKNAKEGKPIDQKDMEFLEKGYRGIYGGLFLLVMLALFKGVSELMGDDDYLDYVPSYDQLTSKERQYYKAVNGGKYNAIKVGNVWISADYFGGLSDAIATLGTWYHNNSLISAGSAFIMRSPVIGDLIAQRDDLQRDIQYDKELVDIAMESVATQSKKYIPGIAQDLWKAREKGVIYPIFGGSFGFTQGTSFGFGESNIKAVKDAQIESGASYMPITRGKAFADIDDDKKREINKDFDELYNAEVSKWLRSHQNTTPEDTKKALNAIRKNLTKKIKQKYKIK